MLSAATVQGMSRLSPPKEEPMEPSPALTAPSDDEALILWMLSLTPTQRLLPSSKGRRSRRSTSTSWEMG